MYICSVLTYMYNRFSVKLPNKSGEGGEKERERERESTGKKITLSMFLASSPGPEKRAWYTLTAHASIYTQNSGKTVNHTVYCPYTIT